ncbi:hypothetical protein KP509_28G023100 [Ceratopteris richardii]|nr:hypothetical protein KP509_28G023100 [Ceratopteris richardii]
MHRIFCASDTVEGTDPGLYHQFTLAGAKAKRFGGLLHGFSTAALASVWNVDEDTVRHFLENQNSTSFVKSPRRIKLPDPRWISCDTQAETKPRNNMQIAEFTYNMNSKYPDFSVRSGGWKKEVDDGSLPVLQKVGMSASMVGLEPNAMEAPLFFSNANQLVYILNGSGRLEVSSSNGETLLAREVRPGMIFAIPKFLPSIKVAGDTGLSFLTLLTSSRPHCSYLIGMSSPYENVPKQVMAEALNIDESSLSELLANRKHDHIIFPPADIMVERKH